MKQPIEGHQNCTVCHPDLNKKWAKRESKGFKDKYSDRKIIYGMKEGIKENMEIKSEVNKELFYNKLIEMYNLINDRNRESYCRSIIDRNTDPETNEIKLSKKLLMELLSHHFDRDMVIDFWRTIQPQNTPIHFKDVIEQLPEDQVDKFKEDIVAYAELETLCTAGCKCEESCAAEIKDIFEKDSKDSFDLIKSTKDGRNFILLEELKKRKAKNGFEEGSGYFSRNIQKDKKGLAKLNDQKRIEFKDFDKKIKTHKKYYNKVKELFTKALTNTIKCHTKKIKNNKLDGDGNIIGSFSFYTNENKKYCEDLIEKYFDQAFYLGSLPKELIEEIETGKNFKNDIKSEGSVYDQTPRQMLIKKLTGLVQNTTKETKATLENLSEDQIKEFEKDIVAFSELETICSSDCNCEESCAVDIDFEVRLNNDTRLKNFLQYNYEDFKYITSKAKENNIDQETIISMIGFLSLDKKAKEIFDVLCGFQFKMPIMIKNDHSKYNSFSHILNCYRKNTTSDEFINNIITSYFIECEKTGGLSKELIQILKSDNFINNDFLIRDLVFTISK